MYHPFHIQWLIVVAALGVCSPTSSAQTQENQAKATIEDTMWRLAERGDATKVVASLRKYLQEFKRDPGGWYYLGLALTRTGDLPGAQEAFKKALKLDSQSYLSRIGLLARIAERTTD